MFKSSFPCAVQAGIFDAVRNSIVLVMDKTLTSPYILRTVYPTHQRLLNKERENNKMISGMKLTILVLLMVFAFSMTSAPAQAQTKDIVDTAGSAGTFNTLAAALKAADLIGTLKSAGPFTVFAPTDEAFAKLPKGTLDALLKDPAKLKEFFSIMLLQGK
jgi:hypothetical protein